MNKHTMKITKPFLATDRNLSQKSFEPSSYIESELCKPVEISAEGIPSVLDFDAVARQPLDALQVMSDSNVLATPCYASPMPAQTWSTVPMQTWGTSSMPILDAEPAHTWGTSSMPILDAEPAHTWGTSSMPILDAEPAHTWGTSSMPILDAEPAHTWGTEPMQTWNIASAPAQIWNTVSASTQICDAALAPVQTRDSVLISPQTWNTEPTPAQACDAASALVQPWDIPPEAAQTWNTASEAAQTLHTVPEASEAWHTVLPPAQTWSTSPAQTWNMEPAPMLSQNERMNCYFCTNLFEKQVTLLDHIHHDHIHLPSESVSQLCHKCGKMYTTIGAFREHFRNHHVDDLRFQCPVCLRPFASARAVSVHYSAKHLTCLPNGSPKSTKRSSVNFKQGENVNVKTGMETMNGMLLEPGTIDGGNDVGAKIGVSNYVGSEFEANCVRTGSRVNEGVKPRLGVIVFGDEGQGMVISNDNEVSMGPVVSDDVRPGLDVIIGEDLIIGPVVSDDVRPKLGAINVGEYVIMVPEVSSDVRPELEVFNGGNYVSPGLRVSEDMRPTLKAIDDGDIVGVKLGVNDGVKYDFETTNSGGGVSAVPGVSCGVNPEPEATDGNVTVREEGPAVSGGVRPGPDANDSGGRSATVRCPTCGLHFSSAYFPLHLLSHDDAPQFSCASCPAEYACKRLMRVHLRNFHGAPHQCRKCLKKFTWSKALIAHQKRCRRNPSMKNHACVRCQKTFARKFQLVRHVRYTHAVISLRACACPACFVWSLTLDVWANRLKWPNSRENLKRFPASQRPVESLFNRDQSNQPCQDRGHDGVTTDSSPKNNELSV